MYRRDCLVWPWIFLQPARWPRSICWTSGIRGLARLSGVSRRVCRQRDTPAFVTHWRLRAEEHTSELQSRLHLVCRLLLEKKKKNTKLLCIKKQKNRTIKTKNLRYLC